MSFNTSVHLLSSHPFGYLDGSLAEFFIVSAYSFGLLAYFSEFSASNGSSIYFSVASSTSSFLDSFTSFVGFFSIAFRTSLITVSIFPSKLASELDFSDASFSDPPDASISILDFSSSLYFFLGLYIILNP